MTLGGPAIGVAAKICCYVKDSKTEHLNWAHISRQIDLLCDDFFYKSLFQLTKMAECFSRDEVVTAL